jgi:hypothetical protein
MPTSEPLGKDIVVRTLREADLPDGTSRPLGPERRQAVD